MTKPYIVGIDIGGTTIKIGLFESESGKLTKKCEIPTRKENKGVLLIPDMASTISRILNELDLSTDDVEGAGVGVPGAVLKDGYLAPCVNLDHWGGFYPGEVFGALLNIPVLVTNDANVAALGEYTFGGGKDYHNQFFVTLGTGIGGAVIFDGQILVGSHGATGEIGHIKVRFDETRACGCGKTGCLEQYASATGLIACTKIRLAKNDDPSALRDIPADKISCEDIFNLAKNGDALAFECVNDMTRFLGHALASVSSIIDPEVIVIGGGVAKSGDILLDLVRKYFVEAAFPICENTKIVLAKLGNDAGIYGAAQLMRGAKLM